MRYKLFEINYKLSLYTTNVLQNYNHSLIYASKALSIRKSLNKSDDVILKYLNNVEHQYIYLGNQNKSLQYFLESLEIR